MSESAPVAAHIKVGKDGRRLTPEGLERMKKGREAGRQAIIAAHALRRASSAVVETPQTLETQYKSFALSLVPSILRRWGKGALGRLKGWPAASQIEAGKMILGVAGIALEARATGSGPLAEMSLDELQARLSESLEMAQKMAAFTGEALQVTDSIPDAIPGLGGASPEATGPAPTDSAAPAQAHDDDAST